jgi:hypothetical protein
MTVAELIAKLSELDPSMRVVVNGYETGFDVVSTIRTITVQPWKPTKSSGGRWGAGEWDERMEYEGELELCESGAQGEQVFWFPRQSC